MLFPLKMEISNDVEICTSVLEIATLCSHLRRGNYTIHLLNIYFWLRFFFKTILEYNICFLICVLVFWIHKGYFVFKKNGCEMFVLKLSDIQRCLIVNWNEEWYSLINKVIKCSLIDMIFFNWNANTIW